MFPPSPAGQLDIEALSGICGSISIACWVVVFSPQIIENFRRSSADGLSLVFLVIWLAGDVFNILGAVLQGVLPTMIILAVYYTLADIVLLCQCFYYRGFTLSDEPTKPDSGADSAIQPTQQSEGEPSTERSPLLHGESHPARHHRRPSLASLRANYSSLDGTHLSPATPFVDDDKPSTRVSRKQRAGTAQIIAFNTFSIALVCAAGILGWYVSVSSSRGLRDRQSERERQDAALEFDVAGQVFGYLCAVLYLGSRVPQLLLNWRRKSTEGVSMLFFLFACIGNLTYVLSIFAYSPVCGGWNGTCRPGEHGHIYGRYILVNASWLLGSLGTLFLDMGIFAQFILYRQKDTEDDEEETDDEEEARYNGISTSA